MNRLAALIGGSALMLAAQANLAQSLINIEPAGGITIQHVATRGDGYALVLLAETFGELQGCTAWNAGYGPLLSANNRVLWIDLNDPQGTPAGKQMYAQVVIAQTLGRKVEQVVFVGPGLSGGNCYLKAIRVGS
jgi:hypothetical protein